LKDCSSEGVRQKSGKRDKVSDKSDAKSPFQQSRCAELYVLTCFMLVILRRLQLLEKGQLVRSTVLAVDKHFRQLLEMTPENVGTTSWHSMALGNIAEFVSIAGEMGCL
jgi:hypothetical protein